MNDNAEKIAGLLAKGEKIQSEFAELEANEVGFDGQAVHEYMEKNEIDSPKEAYRKMNGLDPVSQQTSDFMENMRKAFPSGETPAPKTNSGFDDLRDRMREFFRREK